MLSWKIIMYRGTPPSAGACQTMDALLKPNCGRAWESSSTITAMGRWRAASGLIGSPVRGASTVSGAGSGVAGAAVRGGAVAKGSAVAIVVGAVSGELV